jgi:hypothetical protein
MANSNIKTVALARRLATTYCSITWVLAVNQINREQPSIYKIKGGDLAGLVKRLESRRVDGGKIVVCYEAEYDGLWLVRAMLKLGIDGRVLDPASLQVNRRGRMVKTDRIDVLMMLRALIAVERGDRHVCSIVRIPTVDTLMAFENLWARSFADPDQNVRLTWILSFWSLLASTVAGVIVGHLHL